MWFVFLALALGAALVPFAFVTIPPITDLAQHVAQIRIALEHFSSDSSPYVFQWWTPYTLSGLVFGATWFIGDAFTTGKLAAMILVSAWVFAIFWSARKFEVAPVGALLASMLSMNATFYWGFAAFYIGFPVFLVWLVLLDRYFESESSDPKRLLVLFGALCLLYTSHIFWVAIGLATLGLEALRRRQFDHLKYGVLIALPIVALTAWWYPSLERQGFGSAISWGEPPSRKVSLMWMAQMAFGPVPVVGVIATAGLLGLVVRRLIVGHGARDTILWTGLAIMGAMVIFFPRKLQQTILMDARFLAPALVLTTLAVFDAASRASRAERIGVVALTLIFCVGTTWSWHRFDREDMAGFTEAIESLEGDDERVLGLVFDENADALRPGTIPMLQQHAWAQAQKGHDLNFSFAELAPLPFVYRDVEHIEWKRYLEWFPRKVEASDIAHFDYALVHGTDRDHAWFEQTFGLTPFDRDHAWRVYPVPSTRPQK